MKKILYIITQSDWGGAQKYVFDLATNFQKSQEYQIQVIAGRNGPLFDRLEAQNLSTTRLKHLVRQISPYHDLMAYFEIKNLLNHIKPDIVHLNSSKAGFIGSLAAKTLGIPKIIYTAHGFVFNEPLPAWKKWLYKKIELISSKKIDKIICVSDYDRQTGIAAGIAPEKLVTIHNGVDQNINFLPRDEARRFFSTKIPNYQNSKLLGCVANFYPTKGLDILIKAMKHVDAKLILIGDGPEKKTLQLTAYNLQLQDKILFIGSIDNASQYLKAFDLLVLPSRKEGLPYAILEAAAAGVPIVATKVGGVPEIIQDSQNGYLAKPNDIKDLTDKINLALAHPPPATLRVAMRTGLPPTLEPDFSLNAMLAKTLNAYSS